MTGADPATRVALVTGAGSGIGRATALALARDGASVALADLDEGAVAQTAEDLRRAGARALHVRVDVTREDEVRELVDRAERELGPLHCAVNSAGVSGAPSPLHETSAEELRRVLDVNLVGTFHCLKHELRVMVARGAGAVVNVSSGAGLVGTPGMAPYCASKHAVLALTKTAALENAARGVRVNAVCPGATDTPMLRASMQGSPALEKLVLASSPAGRFARPEEIAEAAAWLCSDRASFVSGESMLVDGGAVAR